MDLADFFRQSAGGRGLKPGRRLKHRARRGDFSNGLDRRIPQLESLEGRALLTTFYVDNNLLVTADRDSSGSLSAGDQVTFGSGQNYQQADLTYDAAAADGDLGTAFSSIAQALSSPLVQPGDTIEIAGGTYTETVTIDMSLTLQGEGNVVIQAPTAGSGTGISINANSGTVTLTDLDVEGFKTALSSGSLQTLNLTNVTLPGNFGDVFTDPRNAISNVTNLNVVDTSGQAQTIEFNVGPPMGMIPYLETNSLAIAVENVTNISVTTGSGSDTFNVAPIAKTITIDGGDPAPPDQPGDTLNMWLPSYTGNSLSVTKDSSGYSGTWSFSSGDSVQFSHIETLAPGVVVQGYQTVNATQGADSGQMLLAQFTDPLGNLPLSDYSADIDWMDGTTSGGTISYDATTGLYSVYGDHVFGSVEGSMVPGQPGAVAAELKVVIHRTGSPDTTTYPMAIVAPRAPETFYVDQNLKVTDDRDSSGGLSPGDQVTFGNGQTYQQANLTYDAAAVAGDAGTAFSSIAQALSSPLMQPGDTIEIAGGTYTEAGLTIGENLTLEGEGNVVIAAPTQNTTQTGLSITHDPDNVTIKNLSIQGFQTSLYDPGGGTLTLADVTLIDGETSISDLQNLDVVSDTTASPVNIGQVLYAQPGYTDLSSPLFTGGTCNTTSETYQIGIGTSEITFSGVKNLSFATGASVHDTINVFPLHDTTVTIDGDDSTPPGAPGDTLGLPTDVYPGSSVTATQSATGLSGSWTVTGFEPVNFSHIASLTPGIATQNVPPIAGTQGVDTGSQVVARFTDTAGNAAADKATIYWGDTSTSIGTITYDASTGVYSIVGSHTYTEGGTYAIDIQLDTSSLVLFPAATANIAATTVPELSQIQHWTLMPTVGQSTANMDLVTYKDGVHLPPSDYSAEINWGDGTTSSGTIASDPNSWTFAVFGDHAYAQPGIDDIVVTILRNGVVAGTLTAIAYVSDQPFTDTGETLSGTAGVALGGSTGALVATFEETLTDTGDFQATINWGDGSTSSGTVVEQSFTGSAPGSRISWQVYGSHTYQQPGTYDIQVSLTEYLSPSEPANEVSGMSSTAVIAASNTSSQGTGGQGEETADQAFVTNVYHDLLNRPAEAAGLAYWAGQLDAGLARRQFVADIEASGEYRDDLVTSLYEKYLHRVAEPAALAADSRLLAQGTTDEQLAAMIVGSDEYFALQGGTADGFLSGLFQDALGRSIDADARTNFEAALAAGMSHARLAAIVFASHEYHVAVVENTYLQLLGRSAESSGGAYWADQLDGGMADEELLAVVASSPEFFADGKAG
jgi:hypothetical protein